MDANTDNTRQAVLIVDDDPVCRLFCVHALAASGYRTYTASDGGSAIGTALHERPQIVLTDMHLPDMSGADVMYRLLTLWPDAKNRPRFIAVSGDDSAAVCAAAAHASFDDALTKPFAVEALLACVEKLEHELPDVSNPAEPHRDHCDAVSARKPQRAPGWRLRAAFRMELNEQLLELDQSITSLDWQRAAEISHRMSGAAALAGFSTLASRGRLLLQQLSGPQDIALMAQAYLDFLDQAAFLSEDQVL